MIKRDKFEFPHTPGLYPAYPIVFSLASCMNLVKVKMLFLGIAFFLAANVSAQVADGIPADLALSPEYRNPAGTSVSEVLGIYQEQTVLLKIKRNILQPAQAPMAILERYDERMNMVRYSELSLQFRGNDLEFERAVMQQGVIHIIASFHNRRTRKTHLFHRSYSADQFRAESTWKLLGDVPSLTRTDKGMFKLEFARDSSFLAIVSDIPRRSRQSFKMKVLLLDRQFDPVYANEFDFGYPSGSFTAEQMSVTRSGVVYLLSKTFLSSQRSVGIRSRPYVYTLFALHDGQSKPNEIVLPQTENFISDLTFQINRPDEFVFAGFYSETSVSNQKGTVYFRYNPEQEALTNPVFTPFSLDILELLLTRRQIARGRELLNFDLNHLILRSDGGGVLIAEQYNVITRTDYSSPYGYSPMYRRYYGYSPNYYGGRRMIEQFEFNEILVANISPEGEIQWAQIVPKRQSSVNDEGYYSSYTLAVRADRLVFLYNDNILNYQGHERASTFGITGTRRSVVTMALITPNGELSRYPILNSREEGIYTRPSISKQVADDRVIIYGEWGNRYRLGNLFIL